MSRYIVGKFVLLGLLGCIVGCESSGARAVATLDASEARAGTHVADAGVATEAGPSIADASTSLLDASRTDAEADVRTSRPVIAWEDGPILPRDFHLGSAGLVETGGRKFVFIWGGDGTLRVDVRAVYRAEVQVGGNLSPWTEVGRAPDAVGASATGVIGNTLIFTGGSDYVEGAIVSDRTYLADVAPDGTLGSWRTGRPLPAPNHLACAAVVGRTFHVIGGSRQRQFERYGSDTSTDTYSATLLDDGTFGDWIVGQLPFPLQEGACAAASDAVYVVGGTNGMGPLRSVLKAPATAGGLGSWSVIGRYSDSISTSTAFVAADRLWVVGGEIAYTSSGEVTSVPFEVDGTVVTWEFESDFLLEGKEGHSLVIAGFDVYVLGGGEIETLVNVRENCIGTKHGVITIP